MRVAERLAALANAETALRRLEEELSAIEKRAASDPELDELGRSANELEESARVRTSQVRQMELEVSEIRDRARSHERALYDGSVRNPADLQRRQHELDTLRHLIGAREEAELEAMEEMELVEATMVDARARRDRRKTELEALRAEDRERAPALARDSESVRSEISTLSADLPDAALRLYRRVAARRQPAVAPVVRGTCSGCRLPLAHRILEEARGDALVTCENCERILLL
ncbi:MAG: zinc ribbon domain-containing protein [Candidatus Dormibacteria bacterium]